MLAVQSVGIIVLLLLGILARYQAFNSDFPTPRTTAVWAALLLLLILLLPKVPFSKIPKLMKPLMGSSRLRGRSNRLNRFALKNGGELGGLANEGNTCFMNSVIQSIASSREIVNFVDNESSENGGEFTTALKKLLGEVNGKYGLQGQEFSTRELLQHMPNGPKQNFFSGYNQEDAQEFYQLVFNLLEKEQKELKDQKVTKSDQNDQNDQIGQHTPSSQNGNPSKSSDDPALTRSEIDDYVSGNSNIGHLGSVYVPAGQVDPNRDDKVAKYVSLNLLTPVDGLTAERVGCLACGENGGIRYSVNSGLSLNLPNRSVYSYDLSQLLDDWTAPEIIEDVNCNRCGLLQTKEFLQEKLETVDSGKLRSIYEARREEIDSYLLKPHIPDEVFEKLSVKQMIKKTKKLKQIVIARPPPLLAVHINRSVFDPRSYQIVKNGCPVTFPVVLDLERYVAGPEDINTDARLPLKKEPGQCNAVQGAANGQVGGDSAETNTNNIELESINQEKNDTDGLSERETEKLNGESEKLDGSSDTHISTSVSESAAEVLSKDTAPAINYQLKSVISHFGTHNYGHYICYRKLRGTWWRISDENVYVVQEEEVINLQGTFMLFYEYDNGEVEELLDLSDDESVTEEIIESDDDSDSDSDDSDDGKQENAPYGRPTSGDEEPEHLDAQNLVHSQAELDDYIAEELRAFHI